MNKRKFVSFPLTTVDNAEQIRKQVLSWLRQFSTCCFLDNSHYESPDNRFECLAAAGSLGDITLKAGNAFDALRRYSSENQDWLFGHFSFSLKSETVGVSEPLRLSMPVPDGYFFIPDVIVKIGKDQVEIGCCNEGSPGDKRQEQIYRQILAASEPETPSGPEIAIRERMTHSEYLTAIEKLLGHIRRGDCYEINYCQEFFAEDVRIDPYDLFVKLSALSPAPFAAFYRTEEKFLLCASPERYLRREGNRVFSQPIKGTSPRFNDREKDERSKSALAASIKDRTENVMIVDLVRNDLSRFCLPDSVRVDELFGIYSFAQVHQMITTVSGRVNPGQDWTEMISRSFPMGSMTGAPKKRVLELIARYEKSARGWFSGALGYVSPERDFDFNVIIRSLFYDRGTGYLGWFAGSGITASSDPEAEYQECLVKVAAIRAILS